MAEPKTARGQATRRAIITAAAELMYERGVAAVTLDDVLQASGTGKSQLYHYFRSRAEVIAAVVDHQLNVVLGDLSRFHLDTVEGLSDWFGSLLAGQEARGFRGCPLGSIAAQLAGEGEEARGATARAFARWEDQLTSSLAPMRPEGNAVATRELARVVLSAIQGGYLLSTIAGDVRPMRDALDAAHARAQQAS